MSRFARITAVALASTLAQAAFAQATVKDDGQWRSVVTLGAALTSGNTDTTVVTLNGDAVKATKQDKLRAYANANYAKSESSTTAELLRAGARYDYNLNSTFFGFGAGEVERDGVAGLNSRLSLGAGLGMHVIKEAAMTWDVYGGLGYTADRYETARNIDGANRSSYSYMSLLLGEESTHKLSATTNFRQSLVLYPNLKNTGEFRAVFDAGLSVAMSSSMSLAVGLQHRYNSEPGAGLKKGDTLFTTGVSIKFE